MSARRLRVDWPTPGLAVLAGPIDEAAELDALLRGASAGGLRLDLAAVSSINSIGVRDWIRLLAAAHAAGVAVELTRVSEPIVAQLNMIVAARGHAEVRSFFAPYACDACGHEESRLLDPVADGAALRAGTPPAAPCPACSAPLAFDDFPERYLAFLAPSP